MRRRQTIILISFVILLALGVSLFFLFGKNGQKEQKPQLDKEESQYTDDVGVDLPDDDLTDADSASDTDETKETETAKDDSVEKQPSKQESTTTSGEDVQEQPEDNKKEESDLPEDKKYTSPGDTLVLPEINF